VVGWVKEKFGAEKVAEIEAALQAQLDEKHSPSKAAGCALVQLSYSLSNTAVT